MKAAEEMPLNLKIATLVDNYLPPDGVIYGARESQRIKLNQEIFNLITEYASQDKWVSVEERLPEFDTSVFVFCRIYGFFVAEYRYIADFQGVKYGNWHDGKELGILPPLFWQPLPNPPKH